MKISFNILKLFFPIFFCAFQKLDKSRMQKVSDTLFIADEQMYLNWDKRVCLGAGAAFAYL